MRLIIKICFILLVMFSVAAAAEYDNSSDGYEDETSAAGINAFSDEAENSAEIPEAGSDEEFNETASEDAGEAPEAGLDEDPDSLEDESLDTTPESEILEHFRADEDDSFALPSETPVDPALDQDSESQQSTEDLESPDEKTAAAEKRERDRQALDKLNTEYEQINRKKEELDIEFKALDKERNKLVRERDGLKNQKDILEYNKKTEALNAKLKQYDEKQKVYDDEVQDFNTRVREDMERKISEAQAKIIETNYEALDETVDSSLEMEQSDERLVVDESAPIEEQREAVLNYKAHIESEYQTLMKQRAELDKRRGVVKTAEDVNALNKKTSALNDRIAAYEKKRIQFDQEVNRFNARMEGLFSVTEVEEE